MDRIFLILIGFAVVPFSYAATPLVTIEYVAVGDTGNPPGAAVMVTDGTSGYGKVDYVFQIGKYEVTCAQYAAFLNAKAKSDPYNLFNPLVIGESGIGRSGAEGTYDYSVRNGFANKPIVQVSFYSALRFCNWLNNGATESSDTETGAYTLEGKTIVPSNGTTVTRNPGANVILPSENEWYKAAFYQPSSTGGPADSYWLYATQSDTAPNATPPPGGPNSANYQPAVSTTTDVGAYVQSPSYYGTFDQDGNVDEWTEAMIGNTRVIRQGGWADPGSLSKQASFRRSLENSNGNQGNVGFRLARKVAPIIQLPPCIGTDAGLVAWWKGDGNANDVTGKHNGTPQNGLSFTAGKVGQGFDFTGKRDGYVEIPDDPSLNITQAITFEAWVKADSWDGTPRIIQKASDNIAYLFFVQGASPPLVPRLQLFLWGVNVEDSAAPGLIAADAPSIGTWHHVAGTYDGSQITLFIDGKIVAQHNATGLISVSSDVLNIGNKPHSTDPRPFFDGVIDEVAIYNRALSAGEIQEIYDSGSAGKCGTSPSIVRQPKDQEIPIGGTARFNVSASGQGELIYQWRFNGARIIGATTNELVLAKITQSDAGGYMVEVTDAKGSVTSNTAKLSIFQDSDGDGLSDNYEKGITRYQIITGSFDWHQAKADAEARGGHLATITSEVEWSLVTGLFGNQLLGLYFGGTDEETEGVWKWVTGEPWGFTKWFQNQPDNSSGVQDWLWLHPAYSLNWDDSENAIRTGYLLEIGYYSDPNNPDTDGDGLSDGDEVNKYSTFPNFADSNQNGISDKDEITPQFRSVKLSTFSGCRLIFGGLVGANYSIEASSNLVDWVGLTNLSVTTASTTVVDSSATNQPQKFYRSKQLP